MRQSYYTVVRYLDAGANHAVLAGRCIKVLHGFLTRNKLRNIGVTFPKWSTDSVGACIAFVSDNKSDVEELVSQNSFEIMIEHDIISLSDIMLAPDGSRKVRFIRNQTIGKKFSGDMRRRYHRRKKRAIERGEEFKELPPEESKEIEHFHAIPITSRSNRNQFMLFVQRQEDFKRAGSHKGFNSYGLAYIGSDSAYVPDLIAE